MLEALQLKILATSTNWISITIEIYILTKYVFFKDGETEESAEDILNRLIMKKKMQEVDVEKSGDIDHSSFVIDDPQENDMPSVSNVKHTHTHIYIY